VLADSRRDVASSTDARRLSSSRSNSRDSRHVSFVGVWGGDGGAVGAR
jgi:hypothetical protein